MKELYVERIIHTKLKIYGICDEHQLKIISRHILNNLRITIQLCELLWSFVIWQNWSHKRKTQLDIYQNRGYVRNGG
jgi:hypothetical protein